MCVFYQCIYIFVCAFMSPDETVCVYMCVETKFNIRCFILFTSTELFWIWLVTN